MEQVVDIDVKPKSDKNIIYSTSYGILPLAVKTDANFNADNINANSIKLGLGQATPLFKRKFLIDYDKDGDKDAILFFKIKDIKIKPGDEELCLIGETTEGMKFKDCDKIQVYIPKRPRAFEVELPDNFDFNEKNMMKYFSPN